MHQSNLAGEPVPLFSKRYFAPIGAITANLNVISVLHAKICVMKSFLLFLSLLVSTALFAQKGPSWKLFRNKTVLLSATQEDETANQLTIRRSSLKRAGSYRLVYTGSTADKSWVRSFIIVGTGDEELQRFEGRPLVVSNGMLAKLAKVHKTIRIYTMAVPSDPNVAATVRVRREHLATINFAG